MNRRKVIQQGKGTLTMSLPSSWTRELGIKVGDDLFVEEKGITLVISPSMQRKRKNVEVNLKGINQGLVFIILQNLYIRGDDEIKIEYDNPKMCEYIAEAVKGLVGFEIVEQTKNICIIKELARGETEDFEQILRRIFLLLLGMAEDGCEALKKADATALVALEKRDEQINRLVCYSLRMLNKRSCGNMQKAMHTYALLTLLEHLGDEYSRLYRSVQHISPKTLFLAEKVSKLLRAFYHLFYSFDMGKAGDLITERTALRQAIDQQMKNDPIALLHLRRIADLIVDIEKFQLAMQI